MLIKIEDVTKYIPIIDKLLDIDARFVNIKKNFFGEYTIILQAVPFTRLTNLVINWDFQTRLKYGRSKRQFIKIVFNRITNREIFIKFEIRLNNKVLFEIMKFDNDIIEYINSRYPNNIKTFVDFEKIFENIEKMLINSEDNLK